MSNNYWDFRNPLHVCYPDVICLLYDKYDSSSISFTKLSKLLRNRQCLLKVDIGRVKVDTQAMI